VQLYRYFMSQSSELCRHNPLCCFSTSFIIIIIIIIIIYYLSTQSTNFWIHPSK